MKIVEASILSDGSIGIRLQSEPKFININIGIMKKVAFTGTSGSGKTTLVHYVAEKFNLKHISGSAGDVLNEDDKAKILSKFGYPGDMGHLGVIQKSAEDVNYGFYNQQQLQFRREQIIRNNNNFVTDRSPVDNMTYFINQVGFHPQIDDAIAKDFFEKCYNAYCELTHVIYIKPVQPTGVENNGSRIANQFYQYAIDAQFVYWMNEFFERYMEEDADVEKNFPLILAIDYWDLDQRKDAINQFLSL